MVSRIQEGIVVGISKTSFTFKPEGKGSRMDVAFGKALPPINSHVKITFDVLASGDDAKARRVVAKSVQVLGK